jgi:hypothetical protein
MAVRDLDGFGRWSDLGGFGRIPSSPAGDIFAVLYSVYGHFDLQKWVPDSDGFGRESDSHGFGRIPGPQVWKSPTQGVYDAARIICQALEPGVCRRVERKAPHLRVHICGQRHNAGRRAVRVDTRPLFSSS